MDEVGRPQDQGRPHRKRARPSPATASLLAEYQEAMRRELRATLGELEPVPPEVGLGLVDMPPKRPALAERARLWDLAIKLGRELGTEVDATPEISGAATSARPVRRRHADYG